MTGSFDIVILGLTITSSWGNGHATTYRSLVKGLSELGYGVLFLERDMPWYSANRDDPHPEGVTTVLYSSLHELVTSYEPVISAAPLVIVGSYVPDGIAVGEWVTAAARGRTAFYDVDTPVTFDHLESGVCEYITPSLIRQYSAYLSFTGGPILQKIESAYGSPMARALYCSVDPALYYPRSAAIKWDLGYLGTYSEDRQLSLNSFLLSAAQALPASHFVVAGPQYPEHVIWQDNVERILHIAPPGHPAFYSAQRFTLNLTRKAMKDAGFSPSVRLFEAAACGVPIISDWWEGLETLFELNSQLLVARNTDDILRYLRDLTEAERAQIAASARRRILAEHTPAIRAAQLRQYLQEMNDHASSSAPRRNRCGGQDTSRLAAGLEPQRHGADSSGHFVAAPVVDNPAGDLHQPAGTSA